LSWELIVGGVGGILGLVFGLLARHRRLQGEEALALLGKTYEEMERLEEQLARLREPLPSDSEFIDAMRGGM
jgi:hypothetical protein